MPTPRVWIATFVAMVFAIGMLGGIVLERLVLHPAEGRRPGVDGGRARTGGPGGPGAVGRGGRGGPGRDAGGRGGSPMFGPPPREYVNTLAREVDLTDAQRTEILTLLEAQESRLRKMQEEARATFIQEQAGLHDRIAAVLTPEQAATFRAWVTRRTGLPGR